MQITDKAKQEFEGILKQHHASEIRTVFAGMGWGLPKTGLALDEPQINEVLEMVNGIRVAQGFCAHATESWVKPRESPYMREGFFRDPTHSFVNRWYCTGPHVTTRYKQEEQAEDNPE